MYVNEIILKLKQHCFDNGYTWIPSFDVIKGAGTFNPILIENMILDRPFKFVSEEMSYRVNDSLEIIKKEYCMRLGKHLQLQIVDFPGSKENMIDFFFSLLKSIGIEKEKYVIQIIENNWTHETLGALGTGYEAVICGLEVAQLTTFNYMCGQKVSGGQEIAIGIERLAAIKQNVKSIFDLKWNQDFTYRDLFFRHELDMLNEKNSLNEEECLILFYNTKKETEKLVEDGLYNLAFRKFALLNHILGQLEQCCLTFHLQKRKMIEELKTISTNIWDKVKKDRLN